MGCLKLSYYPGEEGLEKSTVYFLGGQEKKKVPRKICDNYYPFGIAFNSYKRAGAKENKLNTFQDQELISDLDLNWVQFKWRNHDPAIGRFFNVDPLAEDYNMWCPYAFSGNRVINARELEGLEPYVITGRSLSRINNLKTLYQEFLIINLLLVIIEILIK
jgi:RHS repeat-associated protein